MYTPPCGHSSAHPFSLGNGLFETLILPIQRKTSLLYVQLLYSSAQPIFETLVFVITIQKHSSKPPVFALSLVQHQQIQPKQGHSIPPPETRLFDTFLHFSSNGSTHLVYAYKSHPSAQPLFETFIFIITIQKYPPKPTISTLIFVYLLQINSLTFRLKDVHNQICADESGGACYKYSLSF